MSRTITLPRSVVEQALEAFEAWDARGRLRVMNALRAALEQPQVEQEPVAWIENLGGGISYSAHHEAARKLPEGVRFDFYTHPQPKREPMPPQADTPLTQEQLTVFKYGWKCAESAHGIGGEA